MEDSGSWYIYRAYLVKSPPPWRPFLTVTRGGGFNIKSQYWFFQKTLILEIFDLFLVWLRFQSNYAVDGVNIIVIIIFPGRTLFSGRNRKQHVVIIAQVKANCTLILSIHPIKVSEMIFFIIRTLSQLHQANAKWKYLHCHSHLHL